MALYDDDARWRQQEAIRRQWDEQQRQLQEAQQAALLAQQQQADQAQQAAQAQMRGAEGAAAPGDIRTLSDLMQQPTQPPQSGVENPSPVRYGEPQGGEPVGPPAAAPSPVNRDYSANPLRGDELAAFGGNPYVSGADTYYGGHDFPSGMATPDRKASEMTVDAFNQDIRTSEVYQQFIHDRGLWRANGAAKWSDADKQAWTDTLKRYGVQIPSGMTIDDAGNLNQKNTLGKKLLIGAAIGAGALFAAPAVAGLFAGGGAAAGAGAGAAAGGAGAAAGAGAATAAGTAAAAGGAAAAGAGMSIMPSVITGLAGLGTAYMGARAQSQATQAAARSQSEASASSERTITAQMAADERRWQAEQQAAQARWEAEQEMARKMWDAQEEERLYQRQRQEAYDAARLTPSSGGFSYSGPDEKALRKQAARQNIAALLTQGTPGYSVYVPATAAGPLGRG